MRIAYTQPGATSTALTPIPAVTGAVLNYKGGVVGQPGTQGIPAPYPGTLNDQEPLFFTGGFSESKAMPPVFYPNLYYQATLDIPGADVISGGMNVFSDNQMPVPARMPSGLAAVLSRPVQWMGQRQVKARKAMPRWPNWSGG